MTANPRSGRNARGSIIGLLATRVHKLRNSESFCRLENVARCNPLTSLFIGTFLTASAIPFTAFVAFLNGTFIFGILALTAFQGGMLLFSSVILLACLVTPCFLSTMFAMTAYLALRILKRFHLYEPLNTSVAAGHFIQLPVELLESVASRIQSITNADSLNVNLHTRAIPSSVHSVSHSREDGKYAVDGDEEDTSDDARYGSELSDCAERQIRRRGLSAEAINYDEAVLKTRPQPTSFVSPLRHGRLTLAVNAFIREDHVIRRKKDDDVELD